MHIERAHGVDLEGQLGDTCVNGGNVTQLFPCPISSWASDFQVPKNAKKLLIEFLAEGGEADGQSPVSVRYFGAGGEMLPPEELQLNPNIGALLLPEFVSGEVKQQRFELVVPKEVETISIKGLSWGAKTCNLLAEPTTVFQSNRQFSFGDWLSSLPGESRLAIVDAPSFRGEWGISNRAQHYVSTLLERGFYVVALNCRGVEDFVLEHREQIIAVPEEDRSGVLNTLFSLPKNKGSIYVNCDFQTIETVALSYFLKAIGFKIFLDISVDFRLFKESETKAWSDITMQRWQQLLADHIFFANNDLLLVNESSKKDTPYTVERGRFDTDTSDDRLKVDPQNIFVTSGDLVPIEDDISFFEFAEAHPDLGFKCDFNTKPFQRLVHSLENVENVAKRDHSYLGSDALVIMDSRRNRNIQVTNRLVEHFVQAGKPVFSFDSDLLPNSENVIQMTKLEDIEEVEYRASRTDVVTQNSKAGFFSENTLAILTEG